MIVWSGIRPDEASASEQHESRNPDQTLAAAAIQASPHHISDGDQRFIIGGVSSLGYMLVPDGGGRRAVSCVGVVVPQANQVCTQLILGCAETNSSS